MQYKRIVLDDVREFVRTHIQNFHKSRLASLEKTNLDDLVRKKNPYLFKAKNIEVAADLIDSLLTAKLSSSEEGIIGQFLEELAIFVAEKTLGAHKSSSHGIDLEFKNGGKYYLMTLKSGENWGNSTQWKGLEEDFKMALRILHQSKQTLTVECHLGISYGKSKQTLKNGIIRQISGQEYWYMISGRRDFYREIVEPIGYKAKELNQEFNLNKAKLINRLTLEFSKQFCDRSGKILWDKIVEFNSGNMSN